MSAKPKPIEPDPEAPLKDYREIPALKGTAITKLFAKKLLLDADRKAKEAAAEEAKALTDKVGDQIKAILVPLGLLGVIVGDQPMRIQNAGGRSVINSGKLFDALLGEDIPAARAREIIDGVTDVGRTSQYVKIYPAKG
jgi:hypothetical protein